MLGELLMHVARSALRGSIWPTRVIIIAESIAQLWTHNHAAGHMGLGVSRDICMDTHSHQQHLMGGGSRAACCKLEGGVAASCLLARLCQSGVLCTHAKLTWHHPVCYVVVSSYSSVLHD
jgi:hypothetical protein